eukprot:scaffold4353_cov133-Amphora_coffeaeformis.AAC.3
MNTGFSSNATPAGVGSLSPNKNDQKMPSRTPSQTPSASQKASDAHSASGGGATTGTPYSVGKAEKVPWSPEQLKILQESFVSCDDGNEDAEESEEELLASNENAELNTLLYTFNEYKSIKDAGILDLPNATYDLFQKGTIPIEDMFIQHGQNAKPPTIDEFIEICARNIYTSLIAAAGYTTIIPKDEAVLAKAASFDDAAKRTKGLEQSGSTKLQTISQLHSATAAELDDVERQRKILDQRIEELKRRKTEFEQVLYSHQAVHAKASYDLKVCTFLRDYASVIGNAIKTIRKFHDTEEDRSNLPFAKYVKPEDFSRDVLQLREEKDFLNLTIRKCMIIAHAAEFFGYQYSYAWRNAAKGENYHGPVEIYAKMSKKECILAVCKMVDFNLSEAGIEELDKKMQLQMAKTKASSKPRVARAKARQAKFKKPKKPVTKEVEQAQKSLIEVSTPAQVAAAAASGEGFYETLLSFHSPQAMKAPPADGSK